MTTSTTSRITKAQYTALETKLNAAMELIAQMQATQATAAAQASSIATTRVGASNELGTKAFARPILKLVRVDADYRTDEEVARGIELSNKETGHRAYNWAMEERRVLAECYQGKVACSQPEYVAPISGTWPQDHDGFTFGPRVSGTYIAIY